MNAFCICLILASQFSFIEEIKEMKEDAIDYAKHAPEILEVPADEMSFELPIGCEKREAIDPSDPISHFYDEFLSVELSEQDFSEDIEEEYAGEIVVGEIQIEKKTVSRTEYTEVPYHVCQGHEISSKVYDPDKWIQDQENKYREGTSVWECGKSGSGNAFKTKKRSVWCKWSHHVNDPSCENSDHGTLSTSHEIEEEIWVPDDPVLLDQVNHSPLVKIIHDVEENKTRRKLIFQRIPPDVQRNKRPQGVSCKKISEKCVLEDRLGCLKWVKRFFCTKGETFSNQHIDFPQYSFGDLIAEDDPFDEEGFSEAALKLQLLSEIDESIKNGNPTFFEGRVMECSVGNTNLLDCCNIKGAALHLYLDQCHPDELTLYHLRKEGMTHFVGEKIVRDAPGIRRTKRVYCVFSSILGRVFQEQSRTQLELNWGSAEVPNCRGITTQEIGRVKMDNLKLSDFIKNDLKLPDSTICDQVDSFLKQFDRRIDQLNNTAGGH